MSIEKAINKSLSIKQIIVVCISVFLIGLAISSNSSNQASSDEDNKYSPQSFATSVLGTPSTTDKDIYYQQGMTDFSYDQNKKSANIIYQWEPFKNGDNEELSLALTDKIKALFDLTQSNYFNSLNFTIFTPIQDKYGNVKWVEDSSFIITRELMNKINWSNFDKSNLIDLAASSDS